MNTLNRTFATISILAMLLFGAAFAQDDEQQNQESQTQQEETQQDQQDAEAQQEQEGTTTETVEIEGEEVAPLGEIQVGESQPFDEAETQTVQVEVQTGALVINATSPEDQTPNIDLVGPNGYYERFEVPGGQDAHRVEGLLPGIYSIAASDDGLQVAHTLVEITSGQAASVQVSLEDLAAYEEGTFQAETATQFPEGAYETAEPQTTENTEFGSVNVETERENTRFVVTGPNNYSQEFSGTFTADQLPPGVYVIAGTIEDAYQIEGTLSGAQIATSAVEVSVSQSVTMVPVYDTVGAETEEVEAEAEDVEDVAGGGEAEVQDEDVEVDQDTEHEDVEQQDQQQDVEQQDQDQQQDADQQDQDQNQDQQQDQDQQEEQQDQEEGQQ